MRVADPKACQCGEVLKGVIKPWECKVFGTACTPETPIGTCMVSSEGACAAYYNFGRLHREAAVTLGRDAVTAPVAGRPSGPPRRGCACGSGAWSQGVGFRPFVHRLASSLGLAGHVGNDAEGVFVEVEGEPPPPWWRSSGRLAAEAPAARPDRRTSRSDGGAARATTGFRIVDSRTGERDAGTFVPPDVAVCDDCLRELFDPADRRYRYPFISCTNCGPRFTVIVRLPYDRPNTTMAGFPLCAACAAEYRDPGDRRFHAEPVACRGVRSPAVVRRDRRRRRAGR